MVSVAIETLASRNKIRAGERLSARLPIELRGYLVVVAMAVPPGPVLLLFFGRQLAEVSMFVMVGFARPLLVINHFAVVPDVVVAIVRVIDPVVMMLASRAQYRRHQGGRQEKRTDKRCLGAHL